jgi:hypothetical protein
MPLLCTQCGAGVGIGDVFCAMCRVPFAENAPRNASPDPEVFEEFSPVSVYRIRKMTRRALDAQDIYSMYVTADRLILVRTARYLWLKATGRDFKSMTLDIFGSAVSTYYLNKEFMGSDYKDVTPKNPDGSVAPADRAFKSDIKHNRSIPFASVISLDAQETKGKKGKTWISAKLTYRDPTVGTEVHGLKIPIFSQNYTPERFNRVMEQLKVPQGGIRPSPSQSGKA